MPEQGKYAFKVLACPLDGLPLYYSGDTGSPKVCCTNGHSFDIARQGYINLLNVQDKRSRDPGDTREMIAARGRILDAGMYSAISDKFSGIINEKLHASMVNSCVDKVTLTLLDAGCGEGYYLDRCMQAGSGLFDIKGIGLDISKWAILAAARRNKGITWLVASNRNPPILHNSIDIIFCGFGFPDFPAFKRILKPGGYIIMLDPAEEHLLELRKIIYPTIKTYKGNDFSKALDEGYLLEGQQRLTYCVDNINQQQVRDILTMSPHLYKATAEGKEAAFALENLDITVDVNFTIFTMPV